jgi:hypothetical protein
MDVALTAALLKLSCHPETKPPSPCIVEVRSGLLWRGERVAAEYKTWVDSGVSPARPPDIVSLPYEIGIMRNRCK